MRGKSREGKRQKKSHFTLVMLTGTATELVEIHEADMQGWRLFECFFLPSYEVCYFGWDENADGPEWINLANEPNTERESILCAEILRYKTSAA